MYSCFHEPNHTAKLQRPSLEQLAKQRPKWKWGSPAQTGVHALDNITSQEEKTKSLCRPEQEQQPFKHALLCNSKAKQVKQIHFESESAWWFHKVTTGHKSKWQLEVCVRTRISQNQKTLLIPEKTVYMRNTSNNVLQWFINKAGHGLGVFFFFFRNINMYCNIFCAFLKHCSTWFCHSVWQKGIK